MTGTLRFLGFFTAAFALKTTIHYPDVNMANVSADEFVAANAKLANDVPVSIVADRLAQMHPHDAGGVLEALRAFGDGAFWSEVADVSAKVGLAKLSEARTVRLAALAAKDYARADTIRADLLAQGIQLMDYKDPETGERRTRWEMKR
jgi:cysteinyl-tRNA synthetase